MMNEQQRVRHLQRSWAEAKGLRFDSEGYLPDVESNLRRPLSPTASADFSKGAGSEPARKMRALHSSSALLANFFDFWTGRDRSTLLAAMGIAGETVDSLRFERRFPTGLRGTPPHLDVTLELTSGSVVAVESKFTEHLSLSGRGTSDFAAAYFPQGRKIWASAGLPNCQKVAEAVQDHQTTYHALDVRQLLKHALGLATAQGDRFSLYYMYYDCQGDKADQHRQELQSFSELIREEVRFSALTYQEAYNRLLEAGKTGADYVNYMEYLGDRYFPEQVIK